MNNRNQHTIEISEGVRLPFVGFGTYLLKPSEAADAVMTAIKLGYRHIDTASGYENEAEVGKGIKAGLKAAGIDRSELFVTTKLWPGYSLWGDIPKDYVATLEAFEASRTALDIDYLDLYLIHAPSGGAERLNEWRALIDIQKKGLARAIGVSNFTETHIEEISSAGLALPSVNQIELHPWSQKPELVSYLRTKGISVIAYSSLVPLSTWRAGEGRDNAKTEEMKAAGADVASPFKSMARKYGVSEAQLLLRWGVQNGYGVLPKSVNPERVRQNLDLFGFEIEEPDMAAIREMDRGDGVAWYTGDPRYMG